MKETCPFLIGCSLVQSHRGLVLAAVRNVGRRTKGEEGAVRPPETPGPPFKHATPFYVPRPERGYILHILLPVGHGQWGHHQIMLYPHTRTDYPARDTRQSPQTREGETDGEGGRQPIFTYQYRSECAPACDRLRMHTTPRSIHHVDVRLTARLDYRSDR